MTLLLLLAPILLPVAAALVYAAAGWRQHSTAWAGVVATGLLGIDAAALAATVTHGGPVHAAEES